MPDFAPDFAPDFTIEDGLDTAAAIIGVDEAGRGPWAGPVVAAAFWANPQYRDNLPKNIDDSKKLSQKIRQEIYGELLRLDSMGLHGFGVASVSVETIDEIGILQATFAAMDKAAAALLQKIKPQAAYMMIDGNLMPPLALCERLLPCSGTPIIKGDTKSVSIAAAAIIAKETRDAMMIELAADNPDYDWQNNKGYGTKKHQIGLAKHGITKHHRRSYKPIQAIISADIKED